jgi:hypothetical protein
VNALDFTTRYDLPSFKTGSSVICNPPVTDTDVDFCVFTANPKDHAAALGDDDWELGGSHVGDFDEGEGFSSYRKGNENIILIWDRAHYEAMYVATDLATKMNLLRKDDRIDLFQTIRRLWPGTPQNKQHVEGANLPAEMRL